MSKAKDRAEKAYPQELDGYCENNAAMRVGFKIGYHQAEKDLELTWEDLKTLDDISDDVYAECNVEMFDEKEYYQEVLKRFNKERKENKKPK